MTCRIGKISFGTDGVVTTFDEVNDLLNLRLVVNNASSYLSDMRELFRYGNLVEEADATRTKVFVDNSLYKKNTMYVEISNVYTGWAVLTAEPTQEFISPTLFAYEIPFYRIQPKDIQYYTITLEAEDYLVSPATKTTDYQCSGNAKLTYTPTTSDVEIFDAGVGGLYAGDYQFLAHMKSVNTTTEVQLKVNGVGYGRVGNNTADEWEIINLGTPTVAATDTITLECRDLTNTDAIQIDLIQIQKEAFYGGRRLLMGIGSLG